MSDTKYIEFVRTRITELRIKKDVSEHKMSLDLDKSGSYIRGITSGASMPSVKELFNIIAYLDVTPAEFFASFQPTLSATDQLCERIRGLNEEQINKVNTFLSMIE